MDLKSKLGSGYGLPPEPKKDPKNYNFNRYNYQKEDKYAKYVDQNEHHYNEEPKLTRNYADNLGYAAYVAPQSTYLREVANYRQKFLE